MGKPQVEGHWHSLIEFATSSLDFYELVIAGIAKRQIPNLKISQVEWKESGLGSGLAGVRLSGRPRTALRSIPRISLSPRLRSKNMFRIARLQALRQARGGKPCPLMYRPC